ncbi:MAG: enoyl-CoA hydratase/isomerase family protein [Betaproteobacteria bacterium]|nr:enoyl-CoA hydratase/isomerase family protein [Betaproteobacteria bacterium]
MPTLIVDVTSRGIATITLNRPEKSNTYNQDMLDELVEQFTTLGRNPKVRVVALRGAGKHFTGGADIGGIGATPRTPPGPDLLDMLMALDTLPKPTVALIHGACMGGGVAMAACCDIVIAAPDAFFSIPEVRLGFAPTSLATVFIRAMGHRNFRRYGLTAERFKGEEALRIGLVHQVCAKEKFDEQLAATAENLLLGAPGALSELKAASAGFAAPAVTLSLLRELEAGHAEGVNSPEAKEGIASFKEKRKPNWYPEV